MYSTCAGSIHIVRSHARLAAAKAFPREEGVVGIRILDNVDVLMFVWVLAVTQEILPYVGVIRGLYKNSVRKCYNIESISGQEIQQA